MRADAPPHDIGAESAILGSLLIDSENIKEIPFLEAPDFFIPENQLIFEACLEIAKRGEPIDQITAARQLKDKDHLEEVGGVSYLSSLVALCPTSLHAKYYARIVRNLAIRRRLISAGQQIIDWACEEADAKTGVEFAENIISRLRKDLSIS